MLFGDMHDFLDGRERLIIQLTAHVPEFLGAPQQSDKRDSYQDL